MIDMQDLSDIPQTPALVIDEAILTRNFSKLADYAAKHNIGIRPHTKTHKSVELARRQVELGAIGLTCAKVGEAEQMQAAHNDLLIAYPAIDAARTGRIANLAKNNTVHVAIDSVEGVDALAAVARQNSVTIGILVDLDIGMHRTGVQSPEAAKALAVHVSRTRGVRLDGLFCYPGHVWDPVDQQAKPLATIAMLLDETIDLCAKDGLALPIVSAGSTPTAYQSHLMKAVTEIRPGTYVFNDMNTVAAGFCTLADCAATIVVTVVSTAVPGQVIVDAGSKTLAMDRCIPSPESGYGHVIGLPGAKITKLSEEHGTIDLSAFTGDREPKLGDRLAIIPNHICPCVNLQDSAQLRSMETGSLRPLKIDTRGKLS